MKQSLGVAAVLFLWLLAAEGAKVRSLEALVGEALQQSFHNEDKKSFRLSEQEIEWMLSQSREGGNGQSRLEVQRVRRKDRLCGLGLIVSLSRACTAARLAPVAGPSPLRGMTAVTNRTAGTRRRPHKVALPIVFGFF